MLSIPLLSLSLLLARLTPVRAGYNDFQFATNATEFRCEGTGFGCPPPSVCSHDLFTDQWYCCIPGASDAVCWKQSPSCDGGSDGVPSGSQQSCSSGKSAFCCLKDREQCTQTSNQINICWSTAENPVANLSNDVLNKTYQSLEAASPSATAFPITLADYASPTPSTSGTASNAASSTASSATSSAASSTPTDSSASDSSSGLSGGAIGGIVGGIVGGFLVLGLVASLLWRRRRAANHAHAPIATSPVSDTDNPYEMSAYQSAQPHGTPAMADAPVPYKYAYRDETPPVEAPSTAGYAAEVPGESRPMTFEMEGSRPGEMDGSGRR